MDTTTTNQRIADVLMREVDADESIQISDGVYLEYDGKAHDGKTYYRIDADDGASIPIADSSDLAYELTEVGYSLLEAAQYGQTEAVKILLEEGADINQTHRKGYTPLMLANRDPEITRILCDAQADVNIRDREGWTALHHGAQANDEETIQILLDAGADATIVDRKGQTAEDVAKAEGAGRTEVVLVAHREREMLRQVAGVDENEPNQRSRRM